MSIIEAHYENLEHTIIGGTRDNNTAFSGAKEHNSEWQEVEGSGVDITKFVPRPDTSVVDALDRTDKDMSRIGEDLIAHILTTGTLPTKADLDQGALDKLNARRALRGLAAI
jgi:hypothetical protein|tara:strand:+ start:624 stop:959 length:336 start_codon:yes stop_codon:yes gene_type:complete